MHFLWRSSAVGGTIQASFLATGAIGYAEAALLRRRIAVAAHMPTTSSSLLLRLRHAGDHEAWSRFVKLYTPLLYHWAHRAGLAADDADDLVQDVFTTLVQALPRFEYDPGRSFHGWLRITTLNKWREKQRKKAPAIRATEDLPEPADPAEAFWEDEFRQHVARRALLLMQSDFPAETWQICWALVVDGKRPAKLAAELKCSIARVYAAKFRVLQRLRHELAGIFD